MILWCDFKHWLRPTIFLFVAIYATDERKEETGWDGHWNHESCESCERTRFPHHYSDVTMGSMASQITSLTIVYSAVYSGADQSKHQSSASLAFVRGIHRGPVDSLHKWPVTWQMFPFDDVIMTTASGGINTLLFNPILPLFMFYQTFPLFYSISILIFHVWNCRVSSTLSFAVASACMWYDIIRYNGW